MKILYDNNITGAVGSEENANYPDGNVLDDYPKHLWKSTTAGADATLTLTVTAGNAVAVFNTNATAISVTTTAGVLCEWVTGYEWTTGYEWFDFQEVGTGAFDLSTSGVGSGWVDYAATTSTHTVVITFSPPAGEVVECGVVRAGTSIEIKDPRPEVGEGLEEFSEVHQLNNGSIYVVDRDDVRNFDVSLIMDREDWWEFLHDVVQAHVRSNPVAWRLVENDNADEWEWVVFGRLNGRPRGSGCRNKNRVNVSMTITEVI